MQHKISCDKYVNRTLPIILLHETYLCYEVLHQLLNDLSLLDQSVITRKTRVICIYVFDCSVKYFRTLNLENALRNISFGDWCTLNNILIPPSQIIQNCVYRMKLINGCYKWSGGSFSQAQDYVAHIIHGQQRWKHVSNEILVNFINMFTQYVPYKDIC